MVNNILLSSLSSPNHPQLQSSSGDFSPEWLHMKSGKPKRILICDPFKENVDNTLRRMREALGSSDLVEVGVVESESSIYIAVEHSFGFQFQDLGVVWMES
jgi:hypothetical protein